ncbi:hypothetical protein ABK040_005412 [Willaertia magna]
MIVVKKEIIQYLALELYIQFYENAKEESDRNGMEMNELFEQFILRLKQEELQQEIEIYDIGVDNNVTLMENNELVIETTNNMERKIDSNNNQTKEEENNSLINEEKKIEKEDTEILRCYTKEKEEQQLLFNNSDNDEILFDENKSIITNNENDIKLSSSTMIISNFLMNNIDSLPPKTLFYENNEMINKSIIEELKEENVDKEQTFLYSYLGDYITLKKEGYPLLYEETIEKEKEMKRELQNILNNNNNKEEEEDVKLTIEQLNQLNVQLLCFEYLKQSLIPPSFIIKNLEYYNERMKLRNVIRNEDYLQFRLRNGFSQMIDNVDNNICNSIVIHPYYYYYYFYYYLNLYQQTVRLSSTGYFEQLQQYHQQENQTIENKEDKLKNQFTPEKLNQILHFPFQKESLKQQELILEEEEQLFSNMNNNEEEDDDLFTPLENKINNEEIIPNVSTNNNGIIEDSSNSMDEDDELFSPLFSEKEIVETDGSSNDGTTFHDKNNNIEENSNSSCEISVIIPEIVTEKEQTKEESNNIKKSNIKSTKKTKRTAKKTSRVSSDNESSVEEKKPRVRRKKSSTKNKSTKRKTKEKENEFEGKKKERKIITKTQPKKAAIKTARNSSDSD